MSTIIPQIFYLQPIWLHLWSITAYKKTMYQRYFVFKAVCSLLNHVSLKLLLLKPIFLVLNFFPPFANFFLFCSPALARCKHKLRAFG